MKDTHRLLRAPALRRARAFAVTAALVTGVTGIAALPATAAATDSPHGHDISSHQGNVDWGRVKSAGARFVYVKATEGTRYKNPHFRKQTSGAHGAGLLHGAYHFALPGKSSGKAQAAFFTANGGGWRSDGRTLPPALDLEGAYGSVCHGLSTTEMRGWIRSFSSEVLRRTGRHPTLYTSTRWWKRCTGDDASFAANHPLWLADWDSKLGPLPAGWRYSTLWQYANKGKLPGDQNVFNGSAAQLTKYARG